MVNNRKKMYQTNTAIRKLLVEKGFTNLYFFPHLRFQKDYIFDNMPFDAIGWKKNEKEIYVFQFKTNKKPSKAVIEKYRLAENKYYVKCMWITRFKGGKIEIYSAE